MTSVDPIIQFYNSINDRNFVALSQCLHPAWCDHKPKAINNVTTFIAEIETVLMAFPDLVVAIVERMDFGDRTALRLNLSGTQVTAFLGITPLGQKISIRSHDFHRIEEGLIIESWQLEDWFVAIRQIGGVVVGNPSKRDASDFEAI